MRRNIIFCIVKFITLSLLTLSILTMVAFCDVFFPSPWNSLLEWDPIFFVTYKLDGYNEFVKTEPSIPDNFISTNAVKQFGTFSGFHYGLDGWDRDMPLYCYHFEIQNGIAISLHINHQTSGQPWTTPISKTKIGSSMLELTTDDTGYILSNGLEYRYGRGKLSSVIWRANGVEFYMTVHIPAEEMPIIDTDTVLGKLLSKSSSHQRQALRQLPNSIGNVGIPPSIWLTIMKILPYVTTSLAGAFLSQLLAPRFRKEHDHPKYYANDFRNL